MIAILVAIAALINSNRALNENIRMNNLTLTFLKSGATQVERGLQTGQRQLYLQETVVSARVSETALAAEPTPAVEDAAEATAIAEALNRERAIAETESAILTYFTLINNHQYADAWVRLTTLIQDILSGGRFSDYKDFWMSFERVDPIVVTLGSLNEELTVAKYIVTLEFRRGGSWTIDYLYHLTYDAVNDQWLISNAETLD